MHKVARHPDPEQLFLQNHGGVYRSDDGGESWADIRTTCPASSGSRSWSTRPHPGTAYLFPIDDAGARWPVDGHARVWRTQDEGASWEPLGEGRLPDDYRVAVMRDAMCVDDDARLDGHLLRGPQRRRLGLAGRGTDLDRGPARPARRPCVRAAVL